MGNPDLEVFQLRWRVELLERLVLLTAFSGPVLGGHLSKEESQRALKGWLDTNSATADAAYGAHLKDPALTAMYADEVKEIVERMKKLIDEFAAAKPMPRRG